MEQLNDSLNLLIHDANGQQQIIKIMRNPNGQPLTQEGVKAIVKEVTGQDTIIGKSLIKNIRQVCENESYTQNKYQNQSEITLDMSPPSSPPYKQMAQQMQSTSTVAMTPQTSTYTSSLSSMPPSKKKTSTVQTLISRRRKTDRVGKGLRHFSMKVCEKVKEKGTTTYNEVADELVEEEAKGQPIIPPSYDQKNIRRRVYDALNVLMAMNIISKDKKEIRWIGLPTNSAQHCSTLEKEIRARKERIEVKQQQLRNLILQQVSFKSLVTRNKEAEERGLLPSCSSAIQLPFIIVNSNKKTHINCSISSDKSEYFFKFDDKFEIHDDVEVLKRMGLLLGLDKGECTYEDIERAKTMLPKSFEKYIELYGKGQDDDVSDGWEIKYSDIIDADMTKCEPLSDQDDIDEDRYSDGSDLE